MLVCAGVCGEICGNQTKEEMALMNISWCKRLVSCVLHDTVASDEGFSQARTRCNQRGGWLTPRQEGSLLVGEGMSRKTVLEEVEADEK